MTKQCTKCKQVKPIFAFHKTKEHKDGYHNICKECKKKNRLVIDEMLRNTRSRAKKRNLAFNLDKPFLLKLNEKQNGLCIYSNLPLNWDISPYNKQRVCPPTRASIDRIDSTKGYTKDNVQLVTDLANRIKTWYPEHDLVTFCKQVAERF